MPVCNTETTIRTGVEVFRHVVQRTACHTVPRSTSTDLMAPLSHYHLLYLLAVRTAKKDKAPPYFQRENTSIENQKVVCLYYTIPSVQVRVTETDG